MKPGIQSLSFGYVPLPHELEHIQRLRGEIADCEQALQAKRNELAAYHRQISADFEAEVRKQREAA